MEQPDSHIGQDQIVHDLLSTSFLYWMCAFTAAFVLFVELGWQAIIIPVGFLMVLLSSTYLYKRTETSFFYRTLLSLKWHTIDASRLQHYEFFPSIRGGPQSLRMEFLDGNSVRLEFWSDRSRHFAERFLEECCPTAQLGKSPNLTEKYNSSLKRSLLWVAVGVLVVYLFQRALYQ